MKLCCELGMNFQLFLSIVSGIILFPLYMFIKRYSEFKCLSCLVYICYILFEFDMTGIRQAIAISIILIAFITLVEKPKNHIFIFSILVLIASTFHVSALISFMVLPFFRVKNLISYTGIVIVTVLVGTLMRSILMERIKILFAKESMNASAPVYFGLNILFLILVSIIIYLHLRSVDNKKVILSETKMIMNKKRMILYKIFLFAPMVAILFGSETAARSFMYFAPPIIVLLPNTLLMFKNNSRVLISMLMIVFFITFFFYNSLLFGGFDIVPYLFFWEL